METGDGSVWSVSANALFQAFFMPKIGQRDSSLNPRLKDLGK
jgi:hypothetical protein